MTRPLPPMAQQRQRRIGEQSPTSWSQGPGALVALGGVGFDFVGEVMGCNAAVLSSSETGLCGYRSGRATVRLGGESWERRVVSYPKRARTAYGAAVDRLRDEAVARGADGVVSVAPVMTWLEGDAVEIVLTGLAVRARSATRPSHPFLTMCNPLEVSLLLREGWVPVDVHVAVQVGVRHDDATTEDADLIRRDQNWRASNFELPGVSELVTAVRASARTQLETFVRARGADGCLVRKLTTTTHHESCHTLLGRTDHVALTTAWANSFARFSNGPQRRDGAGSRPGGRMSTEQSSIPEQAMRRLHHDRPDGKRPVFTSDLSVNEFLLVRQAGFRALGLVMGPASTTSACRWAGGRRTWSSRRCPRRCTTHATSR